MGKKRLSMTFMMFIGLVIFFIWATLFEMDQNVRATGQVIPSARTQIIQTADGGVLDKMLVVEGDSVHSGQLLAVLEKKRHKASYDEIKSRITDLMTSLIRVKSELSGKKLIFPEEFNNNYPNLVYAQKKLYERRRKSLMDELYTLYDFRDMVREELNMNETLLKTGDISRIEVMRIRQKLSEIKGKIKNVQNKYFQEASVEAAKIEAELASVHYKLEERLNVLEHADIKAPVTGIVKYLRINTIGGVLRPGDEMMQISPTESALVLEIKITPVDIGQLKTGLPVSVKVDAFDSSIFGSVNGTLIYISSDTLAEQGPGGTSVAYYRCLVKINEIQLNNKISLNALKPGMTAMVDIKTDTRTILQYIAKPVLRAFSGAMSER